MKSKAYQTLIRLLSIRDYSEFKLREKLVERNFPADEIEEAINEIKKKNYLREENYAEARVKAFMTKGYSSDYIKQKLSMEHLFVDDEFITKIFSEYRHTEDDQIKKLIEKKLRGKTLEDYDQEVKIIRYLLTKGHDLSLSKKVLKQYKQNQECN